MAITPTRRQFLATSAASATGLILPKAVAGLSTEGKLSGVEIARRHRIVREMPTPNFFEGMLLGNGDIGVCVTVRPDALGLHLGKLDSWDIRVSEDHYQNVLPFPELMKLWQRASDEAKRQGRPDMLFLESNIDFFREYTERVVSSYRKVWPRPWPCGIVWIHWDSRQVRVLRQTLDLANGLFALCLEHDDLRGRRRTLEVRCFVNWNAGHVLVSTSEPAPFVSVVYYPNLDSEAQLPPPEIDGSASEGFAEFSGYQHFPVSIPTPDAPHPPKTDRDRNFALSGILQGAWNVEGLAEAQEHLKGGIAARSSGRPPGVFLRSKKEQPFRLDLALTTPRDHPDNFAFARTEARRLSAVPVARLQAETETVWENFWSHSAVEFEDKELEAIWYRNQYLLACCLRAGKVAPGLFGNWTSGRIGTAWHGDYHMNYNTQQVFWGVFSSNHVDQHLPYVELVENLLPMAEAYARDKFGMEGAFFPHSAYPVPSQVVPYPSPPWGYEVCETPWTVQSLWWHYLYTRDSAFLARVYPILRAATVFLVGFVKLGEDGKYHIAPSASPENWGCTVDFRLNQDCIMDLSMTEFLLDATVEAARILDRDASERARWANIRAKLAAYPTVEGPYGEVWVDVRNAPAEFVYNVPVTLAPVFPAEQVGLGKREGQLEIARRTARTVRLEGGNDVVYQPLIRARLGTLDLDWFKREVRYCLLPNGVANDRVRQVDGRYDDATDFDFMMRMGVWTENLSLPAVLNECLLQSYTGVIRLFPNTNKLGPVRFENLRATGAFLVSAAYDGHQVTEVRILSEKAVPARLVNPWPGKTIQVIRSKDRKAIVTTTNGEGIEFPTEVNEVYTIEVHRDGPRAAGPGVGAAI